MCRSYKAFFCAFVALGISFMMSAGVDAESLQGYEITNGENGGSYLPTAGKIMISGGEVTVSGSSNVPLNIIGNVRLILKDVEINSNSGAGIIVDSGVEAEIVLEGNNKIDGHDVGAGINVGYLNDNNMASLTISGDGSLVVTGGEKGGAGIGGNGSKDVKAVNGNIIINGGKINAIAQETGAGIGGGLGSEALLRKVNKIGTISIRGGEISATGMSGSAGIGGGNYIDSNVSISGGTLKKIYGGEYAAGIGGGNCNNSVFVEIEAGKFNDIRGYESSDEEKLGGAAIGSGSKTCKTETNTKLKILGGEIKGAVAGWGAAGIGNGAGNEVSSDVVVGKGAHIVNLYTDGEKMPLEDGANIEGNILQVAFSDSVDTSKETSFEVVNYNDESEAYKMDMPKGYRAFATTVKKEAEYSVRGSKYYAEEKTEGSNEAIKLNVASGALTAYNNLQPVEDMPSRNIMSEMMQEENAEEFGAWIYLAIIGVALVVYIIAMGLSARSRSKR